LQAIASVLAVALENARLYGELKMLLNEHQQAQAQLIQAEKMAALGRLVASLAHEINNPLQALRSGFSLLLSRRGDREKQRRYLEIASGEVERLITIVERVLDFYRPSYEQMEPTDINAVLDGTLLLVSKTLEHSRVTVYQELATNLLPVEAMADQLKQVFLNIILNAQQAMPDGGELTVRTGLSDREEVYITFTDTGLGISDDDKGRLFEPFFTTRPDGTGMGLAISYSIVERHGGRIEVDSEVDRGSTFTVILPAQRDASDLTGVG
jgi:two-component system NtrC family sensor kinase